MFKKLFIPFLLLGILILFAGFIFDSLFVNIPPQDPPADILQNYMNNYSIAHLIYIIGLILIAVGLLSIITTKLSSLFRKRKDDN